MPVHADEREYIICSVSVWMVSSYAQSGLYGADDISGNTGIKIYEATFESVLCNIGERDQSDRGDGC